MANTLQLYQLHWFPICFQVKFKVLVLIFGTRVLEESPIPNPWYQLRGPFYTSLHGQWHTRRPTLQWHPIMELLGTSLSGFSITSTVQKCFQSPSVLALAFGPTLILVSSLLSYCFDLVFPGAVCCLMWWWCVCVGFFNSHLECFLCRWGKSGYFKSIKMKKATDNPHIWQDPPASMVFNLFSAMTLINKWNVNWGSIADPATH